jgi:hypothetical protein
MFGVRSVLDRGPSLPDVLAGTPRITTQEMKDFETQMIEDGKRSNLDVAAAGYGTGAVPTFVVVLVEGQSLENTDESSANSSAASPRGEPPWRPTPR